MVVFAILNALFTFFYVNRASNKLGLTLEGLNGQLAQGITDLNVQLEPLHDAVSRSMGAISHLSDGTKQDKALEKRIGLDLLDQATGEYGDVLEVVKVAFPRVAEYIEDRPEAVTKLLPRLQQLMNDPEARKRLSLPSPSSRTHQPHPFGFREE